MREVRISIREALAIACLLDVSVRLSTLVDVSPIEYGLLLLAIPLVAAMRISLWVLPSRTIVLALRRFENDDATESMSHLVEVTAIIWAIEAAGRRIPNATCLTQALAARVLMRWFGYSAQLCFGVARKKDGSLRAHAWVERGGRAVLGGSGTQMLTRLPLLSDAAHTLMFPSFRR